MRSFACRPRTAIMRHAHWPGRSGRRWRGGNHWRFGRGRSTERRNWCGNRCCQWRIDRPRYPGRSGARIWSAAFGRLPIWQANRPSGNFPQPLHGTFLRLTRRSAGRTHPRRRYGSIVPQTVSKLHFQRRVDLRSGSTRFLFGTERQSSGDGTTKNTKAAALRQSTFREHSGELAGA